MILASLLYAGMNWCIKYVGDIPATEVVFFRSLVTLSISWVVITRKKLNPFGTHKKLLILRGIFGFIGLTLYIYTVQRMSLASAVTLQYLSPIFTTIIAVFVLKQGVKWLQWLFFAAAFGGVFLIKGFDPTVNLWLMLIGITGAIGAALAYNTIGMLKGKEDPIVIVFYFPFITIPIAGIYLLFNWVTPTWFEVGMLLLAGVFAQYAQVFMTKAYQMDNVANVSLLTYLGVIWALLIGFFDFNEVYTAPALIGMGIIVLSIISNIVFKSKVQS
jgi:drug/metabolite transporter (DMT)-like permease